MGGNLIPTKGDDEDGVMLIRFREPAAEQLLRQTQQHDCVNAISSW